MFFHIRHYCLLISIATCLNGLVGGIESTNETDYTQKHPVLFFAAEKAIKSIDSDILTNNKTNYASNVVVDKLKKAIDVSFYNDTVYWADLEYYATRIQRAKKDKYGENREVIYIFADSFHIFFY